MLNKRDCKYSSLLSDISCYSLIHKDIIIFRVWHFLPHSANYSLTKNLALNYNL